MPKKRHKMPPATEIESAPVKTSTAKKLGFLHHDTNFSRAHLAVFVLVFGLLGFLIYKSFAAAPVVATLEAENMVITASSSNFAYAPASTLGATTTQLTKEAESMSYSSKTAGIESDSKASGGKRMVIFTNGSISYTQAIDGSGTALAVTAKSNACAGVYSNMVVKVDGILVVNKSVNSNSWNTSTASLNLASGSHSISIAFTNDYYKNGCDRNLYIDKVSVSQSSSTPAPAPAPAPAPSPAPTPLPTVTLTASPASITSGSSSTLSWKSTDATSCTAGSGWSASTTSGTYSVSPTASATYSLNCTGAGGTASASTTVTVTAAPTPTPPSSTFGVVEADATASNGKHLLFYTNGTANGQVKASAAVESLAVTAKGESCNGSWPHMIVKVDNNQVLSQTVDSTSWQAYTTTVSLPSGNHNLSIGFDNDAYVAGSCDSNLYVDVTNFYGQNTSPAPNPVPTVSLSASPSSVSAGSSSTLTWSSANSTACTAGGSWSGSQATSGSVSTGALNQNSTYSITCTGGGGSASVSATVTVTSAPSQSSSTGTVRHAGPGQVLSAIDASQPGDTVIVDSGNHPQLVLSKSFAAPGITIKNGGGAVFAGIDTNGQSGYTFDGISSILPAEVNNYDITPFYLHGGSQRINLIGAFKLQGGYDGIKVYGGSKDCTIDDGGAASSISGYGGDGIHVNQSTNLWIKSVNIYNPYDLTATPEHNDGIHAQDFNNLRIGGGAAGGVVHITGLVTANSPRSDVDSAGMFLRGEPGASDLTIDGVEIHWQIGRAIQIIDIDGATTIRKLSITDSGIPGQSPAITFDGRYNVDVYGPLTGFSKSDCYIVGSGSATWH